MLRLAPSRPVLWRSPTSVQLGPDGETVFHDVTPWQEHVLAALDDGIPDAMLVPLALGFGAQEDDADAFAARVRAALARVEPQVARVRVEAPPTLSHRERSMILDGIARSGIDVEHERTWEDDTPGSTVIVVAHRLVDPRRAARLVSADIPHLPMELAGDRLTIGPLVVPGRTGCLACLHARRTEADPQWPAVAAQLIARRAMPTDPALLMEGAVLAGRLVREPPPVTGTSVTLSSASVRRSWRAHHPHARCLCRSPEGSATAGALGDRRHAPTTSTGFARPA